MSDYRELRTLNLNLLPVLRELLRFASVTEAAKVLNLSQSSVSGSLRALREHFDDELLTTVGRTSQLTAYARELVGPVDAALGAVQAALFNRDFDPATAHGRFFVAAPDYVGTVLAPGFAQILEPTEGLAVQLTHLSLDAYAGLETGEIDLVLATEVATDRAFGHLKGDLVRFARQRLWVDEAIGIARRGTTIPEDLDGYVARPHAAFQLGPRFTGSPEWEELERQDIGRADRVFVPNVHMLPITVALSNCLAVVPDSLAACYETVLPLQRFAIPFEAPAIRVEMVWMARDTPSPRLTWLRDRVCQIVRETHFLPD